MELSIAARELRTCFLNDEDVKCNKYHEADVKRLIEDDVYCQCFVRHHRNKVGDTEKSLEMVKRLFKWRNDMGVNDIKDSDFPDEFVQTEPIYFYRKDNQGNVTIMAEGRNYLKDSKKDAMRRRYFIHLLESVEKKYGERKAVIVADGTGAGLRNIDIEFAYFCQSVFVNNYPETIAYILLYNMPLVLHAFWLLVKSWLPEKVYRRIKFVKDETITDYISAEDLPQSMGGLVPPDRG